MDFFYICSAKSSHNFVTFKLNEIMKKAFVMMMTAMALLASCEKQLYLDEETVDGTDLSATETKKFTFTCKGDFTEVTSGASSNSPKRAKKSPTYLSDNEQQLTDLWVFDYSGGKLIQQTHQASTDEDFGKPTMNLAYGSHHVYFVASRGTTPTLDTAAGTIVWEKVHDTFWQDYEVTVQKTSNGNRAVTLDRVITMLTVSIEDEIPENLSSVTITPQHWYYGLNYTDGTATGDKTFGRKADVPSSYIGTSGNMNISIYSISNAGEWTTDIAVSAEDAGGAVIGSAAITGAPFQRNRRTHYSGSLFSEDTPMTISLNSDWEDTYEGTW